MKQKWIVGLILILTIAGSVFAYQKTHTVKSGAQENLGKELKAKGAANAKVTIVGYSDFQCPACAAAEPVINEFLKNYPADVRFIFRHFPLKSHIWSNLAHQSTECAHRQGKFWELHDKLFHTQKEWSTPVNPTERILEYAKQAGLNLDQFATCLSDPKVTEIVLEERLKGEQMQIQSTPTFFIEGERLVGPMELQVKGESVIRNILGLPPKPAPELPVSAPVPAAPQTAASSSAPAPGSTASSQKTV